MTIHRRYTHEIWHYNFMSYIELLDGGLERPKHAGEVKDLRSSKLSVYSRFTLTAN
jgi:hypothetical protein